MKFKAWLNKKIEIKGIRNKRKSKRDQINLFIENARISIAFL